MTEKMAILVGTVGQGIMRSTDKGETWKRIAGNNGMHTDAQIRALVLNPHKPEIVSAGTERGFYRSEDAGQSWQHVDSALNDHAVWALAVNPSDPQIIFAGTGTTSDPHIFRSTDGGMSWEQRSADIAEECLIGVPRVTAMAVDPVDSRNVWASVEVDGVRHSTDGGDTWARLDSGGAITNPDTHNIAVLEGPPKTVVIVVNDEVHTSTDDGATWQTVGVRESFPWHYPRGVTVAPDGSKTIFVSIGDFTPGTLGTVMRSKDAGATWENLSLPVLPNSTVWTVNVQPQDPNLVFAASRYGYLYRSEDGGDSWRKTWREFSEISSVVWIPTN